MITTITKFKCSVCGEEFDDKPSAMIHKRECPEQEVDPKPTPETKFWKYEPPVNHPSPQLPHDPGYKIQM